MGIGHIRIARGAGRLCCIEPRGMRGLPDAAVACLGAGGGVLSPGTKSKMGSIFSKTLLRSASSLPSARGIHVPNAHQSWSRVQSPAMALALHPRTLVFAITSLNLFVHTLLHLALENAGSAGLVIVRDLQDVCSIDPVVGSAAHAVVALAVVLVDRDLSASMISRV